MDGLEAPRLIRAAASQSVQLEEDQPPQPHIVFLTAHAFDKFQDAAFAAGADGFISKPYNLQKIRGLLESLSFPKAVEANYNKESK